MPQKATSEEDRDCLSRKQRVAIERLLLGDTVTDAAKSAGVSRETVHRWRRESWDFQAALNRGQREFQQATESQLRAACKRAAENIVASVDAGDVRTSLVLLKSVGALAKAGAAIGSEDSQVLRELAQIKEGEENADRLFRGLRSPVAIGLKSK